VDRELEVIHDQMEGTRASLADKLGALESQVRETVTSTVDGVKEVVQTVTDKVESVSDGVAQTFESVSESVSQTVESVSETIAGTFNVTKHVEQHPWAAVGVAVAVGFVAAQVLPSSRQASAPAMGYSPAPAPSTHSSLTQAEGGMLHGAWDTASTGIQKLAVGGLMSFIREMVEQATPPEWKSEVHRFVDDVTSKLGGKPMPAVKHEESHSTV
jgi:ElaB/YqjD/DUF883 family membrane-anchored ribosome-binding protein